MLFLGAQATLGASNSLILQGYEGEEEEKLLFLKEPFLKTILGRILLDSNSFRFF